MPFPLKNTAELLIAAALLTACGGPESSTLPSPRRAESGAHYRPLDGLLTNVRLQELVDLQVARNGAGLAAALADADPLVRARAAFALGSVQDTIAVPGLIAALGDGDARVRADAAFALGQTPTPAGAAALLAHVRVEQDTVVLLGALDALGKAGTLAELGGLIEALGVDAHDGPPELVAALALAYARFGMRGVHDARAIEWLLAALRSSDGAVRRNAGYFFARSRDPVNWLPRREMLAASLERYDPADRAAMQLLTALGRQPHDSTDSDVPLFAEWLATSPDWAIRVNAARALGQRTTTADARAALMNALRDPSHHVRVAASAALAASPDLSAADGDLLTAFVPTFAAEPPVHGALMSAAVRGGSGDWVLQHWLGLSDVRLRRAGLSALARIPGGAAFVALDAAARDSDSTVAAAAVAALAERRALDIEDVGDARYFTIFAHALRTRELAQAATAAGALADSTFEPLGAGPLLQSVFLQLEAPTDLEVMVEIVKALGAVKDPTAEPLLRELRTGRWPELRTAAAQSLARITGEPAGLPNGGVPPSPAIEWDWLAQWGSAPTLRIETVHGAVVLELSVEQAPLTAQTMLILAGEGRYDGVPFHRVVPNFVVQGGDVQRGDGWGGPGFAIRSELTRIPFVLGTAGVASSGKDTEGSQYFVTHSMQPHLDGRYTAFGTIVDGLGAVDALREGDIAIRVVPSVTP